MKFSSLFLAASVAVNAALLGLLIAGAADRSVPVARPAAVNPAAAPAAAHAPAADAWAKLQTDDLAVQRDRLRAEGFPPKLIRAILAAQVREGFAARRKAITAAQAEQPFWKPSTTDPKVMAQLRALSKEEQKIMTDLLGPDPENSLAATLRRQLPNLSDDKIAQLAAIRESYDQRRSDLYAGINGPMTLAADREKIAALDKAMHAEFASVLTPQEIEDYDLRNSSTANQLRYNLTAFDATEQEYRELYRLQSAFDQKFGQLSGPLSQDDMKARNDAQNGLESAIQAALGDARYAEYHRAIDYNYRQTSQLVARLELPPETANQVYALQQDFQQRARAVQMDRTLAPEDRNTQLAALAVEAQSKVTAALGARGYEAYKQYGGSWLQILQPRPVPPPRPAAGGG